MASPSILRAGVTSPARAFMRPTSTRSILKRPAPLPLSPNPFPFAASFSVVVSSAKLSPHVHFPSSPAMAAAFSALSPNTYDRAPIVVSPRSAQNSPWANKVVSPTAHNAFKLSDPPKRGAKKQRNLTVPAIEDPRSPKPYKPRAGVKFEELTVQVPRGNYGMQDLGTSLSTYPRSPYPSAPIEEDGEDGDRGRRWPSKTENDKPSPPARAKSLENKKKRRQTVAFGLHLSSPLRQDFLSPVNESPRVVVTKPAPLNLESESPESARLSQAFWQSVSLEEGVVDSLSSAGPTSAALAGLKSPGAPMMFGNKDGSLWSPRLPRERRGLGMEGSMMSPAQRKVFHHSIVASPSPNDPFAAFPSFSVALMNMDGIITYPPRALVEQK
ncbi:hypothetical protein Hypma_008487 [Hypsizygus marmoreus]|uniref:Uncharacterized protein n=1 Tax=Hypsizygus marmoreus TaxID=39966 RepID=A0A369JRN2_HYPMA|nr:hypothetical protein Hypma_008487 [Hypsizygus marmoreus]